MKIILLEHESRIDHDCLDELGGRFPQVEVTIFETVENAIASAAREEFVLICACRQMLTGDSVQVLRHIQMRLPGATVVVIRSTADLLSLVSLFGAGAASSPLPVALATDAALTPGRNAHMALTARENSVMLLLSQGLPNKLIARRMNLSVSTVKTHLAHIFRKIGVDTRLDAICKFDPTSRHGVGAVRSEFGERLPAPRWPVMVAPAV